MHTDYWSNSLLPGQFRALTTFIHDGMLKKYYAHHKLNVSKKNCRKYKKCCVDVGLYSYANNKLLNNDESNNNNEELDVHQPVSPRTLKRRMSNMMKLALTHNAAVGVTENLLSKFTSKLIKTDETVSTHVQEQMTPIIVRDLNTQLKNHRNNVDRVIKEALIVRNKHISTRKHRSTRKGVCYILSVK